MWPGRRRLFGKRVCESAIRYGDEVPVFAVCFSEQQMEYIALIHKNTDSMTTPDEWSRFIELAIQTGMFRGGSEMKRKLAAGDCCDVSRR